MCPIEMTSANAIIPSSTSMRSTTICTPSWGSLSINIRTRRSGSKAKHRHQIWWVTTASKRSRGFGTRSIARRIREHCRITLLTIRSGCARKTVSKPFTGLSKILVNCYPLPPSKTSPGKSAEWPHPDGSDSHHRTAKLSWTAVKF